MSELINSLTLIDKHLGRPLRPDERRAMQILYALMEEALKNVQAKTFDLQQEADEAVRKHQDAEMRHFAAAWSEASENLVQ